MKFNTSIARRLSGRHKKCLKIADYRNKNIIDIGCSYGWFEKYISPKAKRILAIDPEKKDLLIAKKENKDAKNVEFLFGSALNLHKFKAESFDMAVLFEVIEHLPKNSEDNAIKEIKRILKKNGEVIISTPLDNFLKFIDPAFYFGHRHYTKTKMEKLLENNRFSIERVETGGGMFEILSMILFYIYKWLLNSEIPFKKWFDKKKFKEYSNKEGGRATLFIIAKNEI